MKIKDVIKMANMMEKGNVLDPELAIFFLSELDGMIQSDMMLHAPEEIVSYDNQEQELLLRKPHDGIYLTYLVAMIRQCQGEFEGYENAQKSVEEKLKTFRRWYIQHYRPADTNSRSYSGGTSADAFGFAYLTAYGLAVKHGYSGTEEEWLASLEGQPGAPGAAARMRFDAERGVIQWGVGEQWYDLFTIEELKNPVVEELMQGVRAVLEDAETAASHAADSEAAARGHAKTAADAAADALGSAGRAYASEQNAVTAAGDAQVQAETAEGYANRAEAAAKKAEEAAANGGTGGNGSSSGQNVTIDTTLTKSGEAADAKAVGDKIKRVEGKIPSIEGLAKTEDIPTKPEDIGAQPAGNYASPDDIPKVPNWAMQTSKPAYTASEVGALPNTYTPPNQTAEQVGADPKGTAASAVSEHNTSGDAHTDLRREIQAIREQLTAFLDVDEETLNELSELIARIVANQTSIAQLTTGKVSVSDIIDNLTTNVANKPLSAAQGVAIKKLIDNLSASLANYQPKGNYALESAVPTKVSQLQNDAKYLTAVTAAMITAALGYTPINPGLATLARHTDGLLYLFVGGKPVGSGVELPTGSIDGYVDADNNIVVRGLDEGVTYKFFFELEDGSLVEGGELVYDNTVYYTVTNTLTNCTNSNSATQVIEGESYSATIAAKSGYELESVTVTMGGNPVTVSGGKITIANVTGNIVITAVAEAKAAEPTNFAEYNATNTSDWSIWINQARAGSDGTYRSDTSNDGYGTAAVSNYVAVQNGDVVEFSGIYAANKNSVTYNSSKGIRETGILTATNMATDVKDVSLDQSAYSGQFTINNSSVGYVRIGGYVLPSSNGNPVIKIKRNGAYL